MRDERSFRARLESLEKTEDQIREEQASALGRTGRKLEQALEQLARIGSAFRAATSRAARERLSAEHARLRAVAEELRWYLIVQREALGLIDPVGLVERVYPVPGPLRADS